MKKAFRKFAYDYENVWKLFNHMRDGLIITDYAKRIIMVNPAFERITGYLFEELESKNPRVLQSGQTERETFIQMWQTINAEGTWTGELINRRKNGEVYYSFTTITHIKKKPVQESYYIGVFRDITDRKQTEESIAQLAFQDMLTELPNRLQFQKLVNDHINEAGEQLHKAAVMFIDVDRFKIINDTLGHDTGDQILKKLANRFQKVIGAQGIIARLGGDDFVVLLPRIEAEIEIIPIVGDLFRDLQKPIVVEGREFFITISTGISIYPEHGIDSKTLLKTADRALQHSKKQGRNNYQFYNQEMDANLAKRMQIESDLRNSLERNELEVYYQPIIDLRTKKLFGVEALLRWNHPDGMIFPDQFIPVAEETGLIIKIDNWVLLEACRQMKEWHEQGNHGLNVSVNISEQQFNHPFFVEVVRQVLLETGLDPSSLSLEITENMAIKNVNEALDKLRQLKTLGVGLALYDFGTGYSSLSQLKRLPVDRLKIDKSFIIESNGNDEDAEMVKMIIRMSQAMKFSVVCEGVETIEHVQLLEIEGCEYVQGYHFSRPIPAGAIQQHFNALGDRPR